MRYVCIAVLLGITFYANAQNGTGRTYAISGTVVDEQSVPIPFANIAIFQSSDSVMISGVVTDEKGFFTAQVTPNDYYLKITFLSYEEQIVPNLRLSDKDIDVGTIMLHTASKILQEVVVEGQRSQMELQLDKRVFNVGQDLSNTGGTAADILNNVPSVSVDVDGTVSLRGSENVRILINGKPSGLTSRDPDALRMLQGNMVERVEVITNPSSRYDAEGEVGIINIVLKKNAQGGLNGSFSLNAGYPDYYGASYNLNYRKNKINLFSSYGIDYRGNPGYSTSYQEISGDTNFVYTQDSKRTRSDLSHNISGGLDYFITDNTSITGSVQYNFGTGLNKSTLWYNDFINNQLTNTTLRTDREIEDEKNLEGNLGFKKNFDGDDHALTVDLKLINSVDGETSDLTQSPFGGEQIIQRSDNTARERNWLVQADYVKPLGEKSKFETGLKSSTRYINNDFGLEQQDDNGNWQIFPAFNNNLEYTERIHALYLMAGKTFGTLSAQAGLRGEYSDITTELTETNEINHREYFNLFPSVNLGLEVKKDRTIQLSYSYRISRPGFRDLLPFSNFTDSRVFFVGNPNLNPEYTHSFEGGYLVNWENGSILSSAYYRRRNNVIQRITLVDTAGVANIVPINLAIQNSYGLEFNFSLNSGNWWQLNSSANFFRAITEGEYQDEQLYSDTYSLNTRTTSRMTFFKALQFQASFNYRAPRITTQGKELSSYSLDLALSKDIFKGKGTLTANVRDLFNTRLRRSIVDTDTYYSESKSQGRPRQFTLNFTYRLNGKKERERRDDDDREDDVDD
jgi:outer membrane receptor protein involved in Fe transport